MGCADAPGAALLGQMLASPRWRRNGIPENPGKVIVFAHRDDVREACAAVLAQSARASLVGFHAHKCEESAIEARVGGGTIRIPALPSDCLASRPDCSGVLYWRDCVAPHLLYHLDTAIKSSADIIIFPEVPPGAVGGRWDSDFYARRGAALEQIYSHLADTESRLAFASVVKGLVSGSIEWPRPPVCPEYQHPEVHALPGDVVVDAGLFDSTVLRRFALAVGSSGHVYGFEPEPGNYAFVLATLQRFGDPGNITVVPKGIWSGKGSCHMEGTGASGRISDGAGGISCEVTDLDSFVSENGIRQVNLVKMDIEGAEINALRGAAETIARFRPKLQICAYHNIDDLVEIPALINKIAPGYKCWFQAHVPYLNEYVYYFRHDG